MTQNQIDLIRDSWSKVSWQSPQLVSSFHLHLFNVDHEAQSLFVSSNSNKVTGMMMVIDVAVGMLDQWEQFVQALRDFGRRHVAYGVSESHYAGFGKALLLTLREFLGASFTQETQEAWGAFYQRMTQSMLEGAKT
jgi:hemoglobin-like flavoprotein